MTEQVLPPGASFRTWQGTRMRVSSMYSVAGISTSFFLDTEEGRIQMEAGDGCARDIIEIQRETGGPYSRYEGNPVERLAAVIISHGHYDHYSGLLNLLNFLHLMDRRSTLKILHPSGSAGIGKLADLFLETLWERCPFGIEMVEVEPGDSINIGGFSIQTIPVTHRNSRPGVVGGSIPSMAYSISRDGERVAYSGDTCPSPKLEEFIRDSDLAIIEATYSSTPTGHEEVHMDVDSAKRTGSFAKEYWLTHFTGDSFQRAMGR